MTALEQVRRTRRRLALVVCVRALAWAGAAGLGVLAIGAGAGSLAPLPSGARAAVPWAALLAGLGTLAALAWRERFVWSSRRVALWLEEHAPTLRYALVTAIDPRYAATLGPALEPAIAQVDTRPLVRHAARRSVVPALIALAAAALAFAVVPAGWAVNPAGAGPRGGSRGAGDLRNRLDPIGATVTPPAYAVAVGARAQKLEDPTTIAGLAGSRVEITGRGAPDGIEARLGDTPLAVTGARDDWSASFTLPDSATALRLVDRQYSRLLVLAPRRDEAPVVQLVLPARDTTVRTPSGSITLDARLGDDLGLARGRFEYIISSGEGEGNFTFRQGTLGARAFANAKDGRLRVAIPLDSFKLQPGDQLSIRAVAIDNNTYSGPDTGYSDPRMLRVARAGEYDSLAVEGAPPPADSALMTLRYLIQLSEGLHKARKTLPRKTFVDSSRGLGARAERLRTRVQQLQADQTMGGMFPPNPLLNTAYLALAEGEGALKVAEPGEAVPHLWDALRALQKYAWAERYYLRGRVAEPLVDLARVRLTGSDTGYAKTRKPREAADSGRARLRRDYVEALAGVRTAPDDAVERLAAIQVEALRTDPALATALGEALAALRAGRDATGPLRRARRLLDGPAAMVDSLPLWSGAW